MERTASTIAGVSFSANVPFNLVASEVRATDSKSSRSTSLCSLNVSRNCSDSNSVYRPHGAPDPYP